MTDRDLALIRALQSTVEVEREEAAREIRDGYFSYTVRDALANAALSDPNPTVRYFAVQTPGMELDVLAAVLDQDTARPVRREAAGRLFARAKESVLAERWLVAALHDDDYEVRAKAFSWLDGERDLIRRANLLPVLIDLLDDRDGAVREHAAEVLGSAKAEAVDALPKLRAILEEGKEGHLERDLRDEVTRAIQRIEASAAARAKRRPNSREVSDDDFDHDES